MKKMVMDFNQFVNESGVGYGAVFRRDLRKHLVGGKGQKREYDALSDVDRMELEGLFAGINWDSRAKDVLDRFLRGLSKYNSMAEIKDAILQARNVLESPTDRPEPNLSLSSGQDDNSSSGLKDDDSSSGWEDGGYYYGNSQE